MAYIIHGATTSQHDLAKDVCQKFNATNAVIVAALEASLTEADVQANKPQARAYRMVVERLSVPLSCS